MRKIKKTSVLFLTLVMAMVANFSVAMAYSYDFTLVRAVGVCSGVALKNKVADYGFVNVLGSSQPSYTTDYAIIREDSITGLTNYVTLSNERGTSGKMYYLSTVNNMRVRLRGIDGRLKAPDGTHVTGLWSPYDELNH